MMQVKGTGPSMNLRMFSLWKRIQNDKTGATMAEYSIIAIVVVFVGIMAFTDLGLAIAEKVNEFLAGF